MSKIFEELRKDHEYQRTLLSKLVDTTGETEDRKRHFYNLKHELDRHAKAEERYFYKPLISKDMTQDKARHGIHEHEQIDEILEKMTETDWSSPEWIKLAIDLKHKVEHHLDEEEKEMFQMAGKVLDEDQKENLAESFSETRSL